MAYDPLAALANSSTVMRRPMAQGGYPALSYGGIQNPMRGRRSQMGGYADQYGAEPGSYAASSAMPYRPNDAFDQYGNDTTVKGYTPPQRPNDAFDQWGRDTTVKGYTGEPPRQPQRPMRPQMPTRYPIRTP